MEIYNNTNTVYSMVEFAEEFRPSFRESILLTVLTGSIAFMIYIARRMKLL